ncbi:MAG: DEAD/DEAH box helicase [Myxococcota bacterium]
MQTTWTPDGTIFVWSSEDPLDEAVQRELPGLAVLPGEATVRALAQPGERLKRVRTPGVDIPFSRLVSVLGRVDRDTQVSDSVRCISAAIKLGLHLAVRQRAVPTAERGEARWRALIVHADDRASLAALVRSLPTWARCAPTDDRGAVRLPTAERVVRWIVDRTIDTVYRTQAWPNSARGWARDLAEALRDEPAQFLPREARYQAIPDLVRSWSYEAESGALAVMLRMGLPKGGADYFPLSLHMSSSHHPTASVPMADAWIAGAEVDIGDHSHEHPAHHALRGLARASDLWTGLRPALQGRHPQNLELDATEAWDFLANGVDALREAGFRVRIPKEFEAAGSRRLRAQMRIEAPEPDGEHASLGGLLTFRWEVTIGGQHVDGITFQRLVSLGSPIVQHEGQWVLLDPAEVQRLPEDLTGEGTLPAAVALKSVLVGSYEGVPVVADQRLDMVVDALRNPPEIDVPETFQGVLRPYQLKGLYWLATLGRLGLGACLADDMGLGKTIQLIAHILDRRSGPHLIVCPTSVLGNWARELQRFAPSLTVLRHHGLHRDPGQFHTHDVVLTTYGLVTRDQEALSSVMWDVVALDEAQAIKNPDSKRARAARTLPARHRVAMSGTPVENRLDELWSLMEFLVPGLLGPRRTFHRNVAVPIERFGDEDLALQLKKGVSPFLLRRLKTDPNVIDDLPDKVERKEYTALTVEQGHLYEQVVNDAMERIGDADSFERRGHVLAMLTALKQVCNHPDHYLKEDGILVGRSGKLDRFSDLIGAIVEIEDRALVFTQYKEMGVRLQRFLREEHGLDAPFLHGGTPADHREHMVDAFQTDDDACPILLISLRAGGTGLNLTRATHVIHYDRWWNPAVEDQATDRAYRIGQHRNVQVHKMVTQGTLEERIDALLEEKRALAEQVVGSGERWVAELDNDALRALVALGDDALVEAEA